MHAVELSKDSKHIQMKAAGGSNAELLVNLPESNVCSLWPGLTSFQRCVAMLNEVGIAADESRPIQ